MEGSTAFGLEAEFAEALGGGWRPRMQEGGLRGERIHDCAEVGGEHMEGMELRVLVLTFD